MAQSERRHKQGKGKKNRKHGRWLRKPSYKRYLAERRWIRNKARRIARYVRKHPNWKPTNLDPDVAMWVEKLR